MYRFYVKNYKKKYKPLVDNKTYHRVLEEFNKKVCHEMIYNAFELRLGRLGKVRGVQFKVQPREDLSNINKVYPIDFKRTLDLWKEEYPDKEIEEILEIPDRPIIRHRNKQTNGHRCKWYWDKRNSTVKNVKFYNLVMTRGNKRAMSHAFSDPDLVVKYFGK